MMSILPSSSPFSEMKLREGLGEIMANGLDSRHPFSPASLKDSRSVTDLSLEVTSPWKQGEIDPNRVRMADTAPRMTAHPQIPYRHLPNDCAYSKLMGLEKTKMLFLLEPYLAAVLFGFSPN